VQERLTTTVSTKGQVVLPKAIRDQRQWPAGTKLIVEETPEGVLLKSLPLFAITAMADVFGSLRPTGVALSIDDMNAVRCWMASRQKLQRCSNKRRLPIPPRTTCTWQKIILMTFVYTNH
jgi:AbrB family looped-hinge helix DNA binding protein